MYYRPSNKEKRTLPPSSQPGRVLLWVRYSSKNKNNCLLTLYIHTQVLSTKKSEGKGSEMSEIACSSSGMMSATLAETVAHVDQPWEMMFGCWSDGCWLQQYPAHPRGDVWWCLCEHWSICLTYPCLDVGSEWFKPNNSEAGTRSLTIIRLVMWEG